MHELRQSTITHRNRQFRGAVLIALFTLASENYAHADFVKIHYPHAVVTNASAINNAGWIIGAEDYQGDLRAPDGTFSAISSPCEGCHVAPMSINQSGAAAGEVFDSEGYGHGFYMSASGTVSLFDVSGAARTDAVRVNDSGVVIGAYQIGAIWYGYTRTPDSTIASFNVDGATITNPTGINAGGEIVGDYYTPDNVEHGFTRSSSGEIQLSTFHTRLGPMWLR